MADNLTGLCVPIADLSTFNKIERIVELQNGFIKEYGFPCTFIVKVPGRVNLIGEHVDYCGYPVFPMAVEQNILLAVAPTVDIVLHLTNINTNYKSFKIFLNDIQIKVNENTSPEWYNYFFCGVKGVFEELPKNKNLTGMLVMVSGNIPPASGLSSSSALVSAAVLATSYINNFSLNKQLLSIISANCERFIGTQGGGMDQAIAFLAQKGCAQFIEWNPLKATSINLPNDLIFVIANSLTEANKAANSDFNQRVVECRLGCCLIAKNEGIDWKKIDKFAILQKYLNCTIENMELLAKKYLTKTVYTIDDILMELDISLLEFENTLLSSNTKHLKEFKIRQRALHVFQESIRVKKFREIATSVNCSTSDLSNLMRESHQSLNELYECSHLNLNRMIQLSDDIGVGARLTGAGWGGCIVALCNSIEESLKYINHLKENYYKNLPNNENINLETVIFPTSPQGGAEILV